MKSHILAERHWKSMQNEKAELAVLPWGATEPHNFHLPYGTDVYETERIAEVSAGMAIESGAKVLVLPCIPFGVNTGQKELPGAINLMPSTQLTILRDVAKSLQGQGISKLLILNGHGGNDFKPAIREIQYELGGFLMLVANWYTALDKSKYFSEKGDHADEMETSLMMYLFPDLVLPLDEAGNGSSKKFRIQELNEGWAWTERKWVEVSEDTGIGNPHKANAQKGEIYFRDLCRKLAQLMENLCKTDLKDFYE